MTNEKCHYDNCMVQYNNTMFITRTLFSEYHRVNTQLIITENMNILKEDKEDLTPEINNAVFIHLEMM